MKRTILLFSLITTFSLFPMSEDEISGSSPYSHQPCIPAYVTGKTVVTLEPMDTFVDHAPEPVSSHNLSTITLAGNAQLFGELAAVSTQVLKEIQYASKKKIRSAKPGEYKCKDCGNVFTWTWGVTEHKKYACVGQKHKKFRCKITGCGHVSNRPSDLKRHMALPHPVKLGRPALPHSKSKKRSLPLPENN